MIKYFFLFFLIFANLKAETLSRLDLIKLDSIYYNKISKKPYTGKIETFYRNGNIKESGGFLNGKKDGIWVDYYQNGRLHFKAMYKLGKQEGIWKLFWRDGSIYSEYEYLNGIIIE